MGFGLFSSVIFKIANFFALILIFTILTNFSFFLLCLSKKCLSFSTIVLFSPKPKLPAPSISFKRLAFQKNKMFFHSYFLRISAFLSSVELSYFVLKLYVPVQLTKVHEELRASNLLLADMGQMNSNLQLQLLSLEVLLPTYTMVLLLNGEFCKACDSERCIFYGVSCHLPM